jgi:hypothetical protein
MKSNTIDKETMRLARIPSTPEQDLQEMRKVWAAQSASKEPSARNVAHWNALQKAAFRKACLKALA